MLAREIRLKPEEKKDWIHSLKPETDVEIGNLKIRTLKSTDLGVAFMVETEGRRIYHARRSELVALGRGGQGLEQQYGRQL